MRPLTRKAIPTGHFQRGFTLVEVILSIAILGLLAVATSHIHSSGLGALEAGYEYAQIDSAMRSRMEQLLADNFDQLGNGSESITVNGKSVTVTWTVTPLDLDADTVQDSDANLIRVTAESRSIECIVVDDNGQVGKI
jgi:prepilin-type N-terminal cleavage/methylation domain-containing protein